MPRKAPDPELVAETLALVAVGVSLRDAAQTAGVSEGAVRQWIKKGKRLPSGTVAPPAFPSAPPIPDHMAPPTPAEPAVEVGNDMVAGVRAMMNRALQRSAAAEAAGNFSSAQRDSRDAAAMATVLARLTRSEAEDRDVIRVTAVDIAAADADLTARLAAHIERGGVLRCADCSRALSVAWGLGPDEATQ